MISHMLFFPIWYVLNHSNVGNISVCLFLSYQTMWLYLHLFASNSEVYTGYFTFNTLHIPANRHAICGNGTHQQIADDRLICPQQACWGPLPATASLLRPPTSHSNLLLALSYTLTPRSDSRTSNLLSSTLSGWAQLQLQSMQHEQ